MRRRRIVSIVVLAIGIVAALWPTIHEEFLEVVSYVGQPASVPKGPSYVEASSALASLPVKGRAPKTGYSRDMFGDGWSTIQGCSTREIILNRDLTDKQFSDECTIETGVLNDPYTGERIAFSREKASEVQIDHVVALSDAWQKGAQQLTYEERVQLANDPLELIAASGPENQAKGDGDAATWLPKNKAYRCDYIARQISVKVKYSLWVTAAEKDAMERVLASCT